MTMLQKIVYGLLWAWVFPAFGGPVSATGNRFFADWPAGTSPTEIGSLVAENFLVRKFEFETKPKREVVIYPEVISEYGALTLAGLTGNTNLQSRLIAKFANLAAPENSRRVSERAHVDYHVFGIVPFEIFMETKDAKFLAWGKNFADKQWEHTTSDGITEEARYWIDDMFMITVLQVQAFRATGDAKYIDRAAVTMASYLDRLQQTNGLFYHSTNSAFYWGRGNGWVAAGLAELLRSLPATNSHHARIMTGYKSMMGALLDCQGSDGLWCQLLDVPEAWPETSGSAMFDFAMVTGVKNGWLDETKYGPAARKAWLALVKNIDAEANLHEVCVGTDKGQTREFYLQRPRETGNLHGQAPVMWTAAELLR